jgi:stearoyl-CoA desaturase (Delta-9 desaturase)
VLTVGYHRLWSHRSFTAKLPLRITLAAFGTLGFQGSIRFQFL